MHECFYRQAPALVVQPIGVDDAEIAAAASNAPVQISIFFGARMQKLSVSRNNFYAFEIIDRQTKATRKTTKSSTQSKTAHSSVGYRTHRGNQAHRHRFVVEPRQQAAASDVSGA